MILLYLIVNIAQFQYVELPRLEPLSLKLIASLHLVANLGINFYLMYYLRLKDKVHCDKESKKSTPFKQLLGLVTF